MCARYPEKKKRPTRAPVLDLRVPEWDMLLILWLIITTPPVRLKVTFWMLITKKVDFFCCWSWCDDVELPPLLKVQQQQQQQLQVAPHWRWSNLEPVWHDCWRGELWSAERPVPPSFCGCVGGNQSFSSIDFFEWLWVGGKKPKKKKKSKSVLLVRF